MSDEDVFFFFGKWGEMGDSVVLGVVGRGGEHRGESEQGAGAEERIAVIEGEISVMYAFRDSNSSFEVPFIL